MYYEKKKKRIKRFFHPSFQKSLLQAMRLIDFNSTVQSKQGVIYFQRTQIDTHTHTHMPQFWDGLSVSRNRKFARNHFPYQISLTFSTSLEGAWNSDVIPSRVRWLLFVFLKEDFMFWAHFVWIFFWEKARKSLEKLSSKLNCLGVEHAFCF